MDWPSKEQTILEELRNFQEKCAVTAKDTRVMILIMLPSAEEVNADECKASLKAALRQRNPDE